MTARIGRPHRSHGDGYGTPERPWKAWCSDCAWMELHTSAEDSLWAAKTHWDRTAAMARPTVRLWARLESPEARCRCRRLYRRLRAEGIGLIVSRQIVLLAMTAATAEGNHAFTTAVALARMAEKMGLTAAARAS